MKEVMPHILSGKHQAAELDRQFREDRDRKAMCPDVRKATSGQALEIGNT